MVYTTYKNCDLMWWLGDGANDIVLPTLLYMIMIFLSNKMPLSNELPSNSPRFSHGWNHPLLCRSHPFQIAICRSCQRFQWHIHQVPTAKTNHHTQAVQAMFCSENSLRFSSYKPCIDGILRSPSSSLGYQTCQGKSQFHHRSRQLTPSHGLWVTVVTLLFWSLMVEKPKKRMCELGSSSRFLGLNIRKHDWNHQL